MSERVPYADVFDSVSVIKKNMDKRQCQNNIHTILEQSSLENSKDQF